MVERVVGESELFWGSTSKCSWPRILVARETRDYYGSDGCWKCAASTSSEYTKKVDRDSRLSASPRCDLYRYSKRQE